MRGGPKGNEHPPLVPLGPVLIRSAALPFEALEALGDAPRADGYDGALARAREGLRAITATPVFHEALRLASPSLTETLRQADPTRLDAKLERALLRYASRMCGRNTPYGTFASLSVGATGARTDFWLAPAEQARKQIEPDIGLLNRLAHRWQRSPEVREKLRYWPTSQLTMLGGSLRCVPFQSDPDARPSLVEIARSPHLDALIEASRRGLTVDEMTAQLEPWLPRASEAARRRYVLKLIDAGVLISELAPASTGEPPLAQLTRAIAPIPALAGERGALESLRQQLDRLETTPPGAPLERYTQIESVLQSAPLGVSAPIALHVDSWRPAERALLGPEVIRELQATVDLLGSLPRPPASRLQRFINQFQNRYDTRYMPLMEVLDEDHGIGFAKDSFQDNLPLLDGIPPGQSAPTPETFGDVEQVLLKKVLAAAAAGQQEVTLQPGDLPSRRAPAGTVTVVSMLSATSSEAVARGEFTLFETMALTTGGGRFFSRFCRLSPEIEAAARALMAAEAHHSPDVLADLADVPSGRSANVVFHPTLRSHEIVLRGRSGAPTERQLHVNDLLVGVVGSKVVLYSQKLGRHVRVRSANAFDTSHPLTLPLHHFLGALEPQDEIGRPMLRWGPLKAAAELPRVRHGKTILLPASWRLDSPELQPLEKLSGAALFDAVQRLRERRRMPRWVCLTEFDNVLPVDLDNPLAVEMLAHEAHGQKQITLSEYLPALLPRAVHGPEGSFVHELVVPLVSPAEAPAPRTSRVGRPATPGDALFAPGGPVLYTRFYGAPAALETFLLNTIAPLLGEHGVERWFFVRYHDDGGHHLRVRAFGDPGLLWGPLLRAFSEQARQAIEQGTLQRMAIDTYERETERYGGTTGVQISEHIFSVDTLAAVDLLALAASPDDRWRIAALGVDAYLSDFDLTPPQKLAFMERTARAFHVEFGGTEALSRAVGAQFRDYKQALHDAFASDVSPWPEVRGLLARRSERLRPLVAQLRAAREHGEMTLSLEELLWSYAHLADNRIFDRALRRQEMVLFAFLERHYRAMQARSG